MIGNGAGFQRRQDVAAPAVANGAFGSAKPASGNGAGPQQRQDAAARGAVKGFTAASYVGAQTSTNLDGKEAIFHNRVLIFVRRDLV